MAKVEENKNTKPGFGAKVGSFFKGIGRFFMNMKHELKKVSWPSKKELINYSLVVFAFMLVMTVIIGVFDFAAGALVNLIVNL
jgi:preprotein translocase subunit SecE